MPSNGPSGGQSKNLILTAMIFAVAMTFIDQTIVSIAVPQIQRELGLSATGMLGPASTDAVNRASRLSYGEATGITQTVRNYAASLGLAILGTVLVTTMRSHLTTSLEAQAKGQATSEAARLAESRGGSSASVSSIPHFYRVDFAYATRSVLYGMALAMAVAAVVGLFGLRTGRQEEPGAQGIAPVDEGWVAPAGA